METSRQQPIDATELWAPWLEFSREFQVKSLEFSGQLARTQIEQMTRLGESCLELWQANLDFALRQTTPGASDAASPWESMLEAMRGSFRQWSETLGEANERLLRQPAPTPPGPAVSPGPVARPRSASAA